MKAFFTWIFTNGPYALLISVIMALIRFRQMTGPLRFIGLFICLAVLGEVVADYTSTRHMPNLYLLHIYTILEFNILALFYFSLFGYFYPRWLVPLLMVGFTVLAVLNSLFLQPLSTYNTYTRGLEGLLMIALSLLCFYQMLAELTTKRLDRSPIFWINTGFLLYFAGNLFLFILSNALLKEPNQTLSFMSWGLHSLLMVLMHLFISLGLWFSPKIR